MNRVRGKIRFRRLREERLVLRRGGLFVSQEGKVMAEERSKLRLEGGGAPKRRRKGLRFFRVFCVV